jgi:glycosyltransferase involved in cell wall biosynthesis
MNMRVRTGVVLSHPIQYFSPLFDLLAQRNVIDLRVAYGNDAGARICRDVGFATDMQWDIDLLGGHRHLLLTAGETPAIDQRVRTLGRLASFIRNVDVMVIHEYATPLTVAAIAICRAANVPYVMRTDTSQRKEHSVLNPRDWWPKWAIRASSGALAVGTKNTQVHRKLGAKRIFQVPFSIDVERFLLAANDAHRDRSAVRKSLGLPPDGLVVAFAGKFIDIKRPEDLLSIAEELPQGTHILMIGDGPNMPRLRALAEGRPVIFTGFLNQSQMPSALACADVIVLPSSYEAWGLIINEAMTCGCVPVVSDSVGCAPDLVAGVGRVYKTGDLYALAEAVNQALLVSQSLEALRQIKEKTSSFDMDYVASAFERAVIEVANDSKI